MSVMWCADEEARERAGGFRACAGRFAGDGGGRHAHEPPACGKPALVARGDRVQLVVTEGTDSVPRASRLRARLSLYPSACLSPNLSKVACRVCTIEWKEVGLKEMRGRESGRVERDVCQGSMVRRELGLR